MYKTKDGKYYHIHGSLDASTTLKMVGLPINNKELTEYKACIDAIQGAVQTFTAEALENTNNENNQAGVEVLRDAEFLGTPHGKDMKTVAPFTVRDLESKTKAVPFKEERR